MKEKIKCWQDKKTGEYHLEYFKRKDRDAFRLEMLQRLLETKRLVVSVETNLLSTDEPAGRYAENLTAFLNAKELPHLVIPTVSNRGKSIFGIPISKNTDAAYIILFYLEGPEVLEVLFKNYLAGADLSIGINPRKPFAELQGQMQFRYTTYFNQTEDYEDHYFDSSNLFTMRSSLDLCAHLESGGQGEQG
ncbi:hypothetical protein [Anaerotalea alkaliphila]|uniref:Uncharacterized protein n=1 Tax=Anaerotalea alkaliphila TaxID=2662126 RepID=A0A7X5KLA7_9FIRM|nr:hypothetical protein [Anaerotalea alkaliphila]NDL66631.1 hypothetical protein [Anaerotalea alkaliphila]